MSGKSTIRLITTIAAIFCCITLLHSQSYSPAAGREGSDALHFEDVRFSAWATSCMLERGPGIMGYPDSIEVTNGVEGFATGKAGNEVVSLGDGGRATLTFENPIQNGQGPDFAVFENSFDGNFLELGFVEVSSDAQHFVRFPSSSLTPVDTQIGPYDILDPEKIHNLAGKYRSGWGSPFDLEDLRDSAGIDLYNIIAVRIIDVIGILDEILGSRDASGRLINDPFPTPFETGGFDLDAVGVINSSMPSGIKQSPAIHSTSQSGLKLYPNPCRQELSIEFPDEFKDKYQNECRGEWTLMDVNGRILLKGNVDKSRESISLEGLHDGIYILKTCAEGTQMVRQIIKDSR